MSRFPEPHRILPTRLGNTLRSAEDKAGQQYGLNALQVAGHLSLLGSNARSEYVRDTRQAMDLSVRLCLLSMILTPVTAVLLADDGPWVALSLIAYVVAYLAYRGAISAAYGYGGAVRYQIDLDRFALYDALHLPPPPDAATERSRNLQLMLLLSGKHASLRYMNKDPRA